MESDIYLTVAMIWAVAAITPGPNFFITAQTAISEGYQKSLFTVLGIVAGTCIWAILGCMGVVVVFKLVPMLYFCLKIVGGLYLIYLGAKLLFQVKKADVTRTKSTYRSAASCFYHGALTNLLNPKTAAFMTSLFAVAIPSGHAIGTAVMSVIIICSISAVWYVIVATLFSKESAINVYDNYKRNIEIFAGGIFVFFGLKLALSR